MPTGYNQWGTIQWGSSQVVPGSGLVLDIASSVADVVYRLGFTSGREITSTSWVNVAELYQWADETAKRLAFKAGVYITYDASVSIVAAARAATLPANHVFTLAAASLSPLQILRLTSTGELWALDVTWTETTGPPTRASIDFGSQGSTIRFYPVPDANGTLGLVCQEYPGTVSLATSTISLPTVLQDYFSYAILAGARGKESESAIPEMAAHYQARMEMYEAIMVHLWGPGQ